MREVPDDVGVLTVGLQTGYETALRRVVHDRRRGLSKEPAFLRRMHDQFQAGRADIASDLQLDSAHDSPAALAHRVVVALNGRRDAHAEGG